MLIGRRNESPFMPSDAALPLPPVPPRRAGALTFGALFALESFVRSLNSTVVSLQAYDLLQVTQKVSQLSAAVSFLVLLTTLSLPVFMSRMPRRWVYTSGVVALMLASLCFATYSLAGQFAGMLLRNTGAALLNIVLSLYIMDHIRRADLTRIEPVRMAMSTLSWMTGPALGVYLYTAHGHAAPQLLCIGMGLLLIALFWFLRLSDHAIIRAGPLRPPRPLDNVVRFLRQPRLRLAWLIAFGRSAYWATFFIYAPILMVQGGLGKQAGGWLVSISQALLICAYFSGQLARKFGVRMVIAGAFLVCCLSALLAGLAGKEMPYLAAAMLLVGSLSASALDGVGGIPFLRAVHGYERPQMTAVYRTYIDISELIPSFLFAVALLYFEIGAVFVILAVLQAAAGLYSWRYLPRSL
jgi:predicted MFS family arabinose efflux permease